MKNAERNIAWLFRMIIVVLAIIMQLAVVMLIGLYLKNFAAVLYVIIEVLAVIEVLIMISVNRDSLTTVAWTLVFAMLPVSGFILYRLWGRSGVNSRRSKRIAEAIELGQQRLHMDPDVRAQAVSAHPLRERMIQYLGGRGFPLYKNTNCSYFPLGELQFDALLEDLQKAEKFIFIQYFIIAEGKLWDRFEPLLEQKAAQGVEVRLMYDDMGSINTLRPRFLKQMRQKGIKTVRFNPVHKYISRLYINYRNHQKIAVIDGDIAYTGGVNLADEYANYYEKHGHWKDTAIRLEGDAAWGLTVTFLQMWDGETGESSDYDSYKPTVSHPGAQGFFQPFSDGPVNDTDNPAEGMYRAMITGASKYVYMSTPYLVINDAMMESLATAAESGVDVRIVTPKIWDHWYVHGVTRSNYKKLLKAGVRIYEYTPGYIHAKTMISDDDHAITGSVNMDYRSFYYHFENAVWICGAPVLKDIKEDYMKTLEVSEEVDYDYYMNRPWYINAVEGFLRIFKVIL